MTPVIVSASTDQAWRDWERLSERQCPERHVNFVCGDCYSILAAMSIEGYMGTHIVPGSVDGDKFFDFIVNVIVCSLSLSKVSNGIILSSDHSSHKWIHFLKIKVSWSLITVQSTKVNFCVKSLRLKVCTSMVHQWHLFHLIGTAAESVLLFLPAYSPDFNPIEESFSAGNSQFTTVYCTISFNSAGPVMCDSAAKIIVLAAC